MDFKSFLDGGAYGSYGVASAYYTGALQTVTYEVPAYRFRGARVFTNKPPCGPKRGHGTPQPRFAVESRRRFHRTAPVWSNARERHERITPVPCEVDHTAVGEPRQ